MAGGRDLTGSHGGQDGAVGLLPVGAVQEAAVTGAGPELREAVRQLLLGDGLHKLQVEGGEAGGIGHPGTAADGKELHVAGGVAAAAQLLGDLAGLDLQPRAETAQDGALAHTGVAGEGHGLACQQSPEGFDPLPGLGAGADHREACGPVELRQGLRGSQVRLVDADDGLHVLPQGDGRHPVDQEGLCHRDGPGCQDDQRVDVGYGGAEEGILAGQDGLHSPLLPLRLDRHPIPHQGGVAGLAEFAPGAAGDQSIPRQNVVEARQGLDNPAFQLFHRPRRRHGFPSPPSGFGASEGSVSEEEEGSVGSVSEEDGGGSSLEGSGAGPRETTMVTVLPGMASVLGSGD